MSNRKLEQGLSSLLANPAKEQPKTATPKVQAQEQGSAKKYETVCYNLPPAMIENVKQIAKYDGKRANAVVMDALSQYFKRWKPEPKQAPNLL